MLKSFKPLSDRVLIEQFKAKETTDTGIFIPGVAQEKPLRGTVLAVGKGKPGEVMTLKEGDIALFGPMAGSEIEVDGKMLLIMRESDVYATAPTI